MTIKLHGSSFQTESGPRPHDHTHISGKPRTGVTLKKGEIMESRNTTNRIMVANSATTLWLGLETGRIDNRKALKMDSCRRACGGFNGKQRKQRTKLNEVIRTRHFHKGPSVGQHTSQLYIECRMFVSHHEHKYTHRWVGMNSFIN